MMKWELFPQEIRTSWESFLGSKDSKPFVLIGNSGVGKTKFVEIASEYSNYRLKTFSLVELQNMNELKKYLKPATEQLNIFEMMYQNQSNGRIILLDEIDNFIISDRGQFKELINLIKVYNGLDGGKSVKIVMTAQKQTMRDKRLMMMYRQCQIKIYPDPTIDDMINAWQYHCGKEKLTMRNLRKLLQNLDNDYRQLERTISDLGHHERITPKIIDNYLENLVLKEKEHPYQELLQFCFERESDLEKTFTWSDQEPTLLPFLYQEHLPLIYSWDKYKDTMKDWDKWNYLENNYDDYVNNLRHVLTTAHVSHLPKSKLTVKVKSNLEKFSETYQRKNLLLQRQYKTRNSPITNEDTLMMGVIGLEDCDPDINLVRDWIKRNLIEDDIKLLFRHTVWSERVKKLWFTVFQRERERVQNLL